MFGVVVLLELHSWERVDSALELAFRAEGTRLVSLDPITSARLRQRSIPFVSIASYGPDGSWEEINQVLFRLLIGPQEPSVGDPSPAAQDLRNTFSHYLISEVNVLFDLVCRVRTVVEDAKPEVLRIASRSESVWAARLFEAACELPWSPRLRVERWDLDSAPAHEER